MRRDEYATDVVCFNKIPGAFLSKPRKKKTKRNQSSCSNAILQSSVQVLLFFVSKCYSKETEREGPKGSNPCVPFYDVIFCWVFFLPWLNIMDNFKNMYMYYMLTVILKKYVSHMCMSYIAKNY